MRSARFLPAGALVALLLVTAPGLCDDDVRPFHLAIRVVPGEETGSERLVRAVRETLRTQIEVAGCYLSVRPFDVEAEPSGPTLVLAVSVTEERNELEYEQSLGQRIQSQNPDDEFRRFAVLRVDVGYVLQLDDARTPVTWKRFRPTVRRRPAFRGEDPQETAMREVVYDIARKGRMFACAEKPAKLARLVEKARREAAEPR